MLPNNEYLCLGIQQPHTAQKLIILIQNYYKLLQNLLCLQKLYNAYIAICPPDASSPALRTSCAMGLYIAMQFWTQSHVI
jgi:hypothetical protein